MLRYDKNGALYFACLRCGTITRLYGVKDFIKSLSFSGSDDSGHKVTMSIEAFPSVIECPNCLEQYDEFDGDSLVFNVDPDIAEDILILNMKGYDTHYSCSSHCNVDGYVHECDADFYCMLDLPDRVVNEGNIPKGFIVELMEPLEDGEWSKYVIRRELSTFEEKYLDKITETSDGYFIPYEVWKKEQEITLKNFKKWVSELPDLNDIDGDSDLTINYIDIQLKERKISYEDFK